MTYELTLVGGRGYTGEVLLGLISRHPAFRIARIGSRSLLGQRLCDVYPELESDLVFEALGPDDLRRPGDGVILALGNGESGPYVDAVPEDVALVDLSADHRFDDGWVYGLPELNRATIVGARRIANPGCYATAAQLALGPVVSDLAGLPVLFGVSGYSGAGRKPSPRNDPSRLADSLVPYALTGHVHEQEMGHHLGRPVRFAPHVAAFFRGISMTVAAEFGDPVTAEGLLSRFRDFYSRSPLVRIGNEPPEIREFAESIRAGVGGFSIDARNPRRAVWVSALDNLLKGAASQAIQNLNLAFGLDEYAGLDHE